jgi:hypothetical protein
VFLFSTLFGGGGNGGRHFRSANKRIDARLRTTLSSRLLTMIYGAYKKLIAYFTPTVNFFKHLSEKPLSEISSAMKA